MKARSEGSSTRPGIGDRCIRTIVTTMLLGGIVSVAVPPANATPAPSALPSRFAQVEPVHSPWAPLVPPGDWKATDESRELGALLRRSPLEDQTERQARIAAHSPAAHDQPQELSIAAREAASQAGRLFEAARDWSAARFAYERAIAMGANDLDTWRRLARVRLRLGDGPGVEAAQLAALELLTETDDAIAFVELRAKIHRDLAQIYLLDERARDAAIALEAADGLSDAHPSVALWLGRNRHAVDLSPPARRMPIPAEWPVARGPGWLDRTRDVVVTAESAIPEPVREGLVEGIDWLDTGTRRQVITTGAIGLLLVFVVLRLIRQRGDLIVNIEYPEELRGLFRVRISKGLGRWMRPSPNARAEIRKGGVSTHYEHHFVNRETHFHRMLTRRYHVSVEGMLMDPDTDEILRDFFEHKVVRVRHRRTVRLEFNARPEKCPIDLLVAWHDRPATDVSVVAQGVEGSLVRAETGEVRILLPKGEHRLIVGCGDRVIECDVSVQSFQPTPIALDLAGDDVVFKGCPPAVEPYLRGDIEAVARALERDGQANSAYLMLAEVNRERGELARAADYFESAARHIDAADLRAELGDYTRAATLYMQAEQPLRAAAMYRAADELVLAGGAYEEALDFEQAIECYRTVAAVDKWINALEKSGETFQAAKTALETDRRPRAIRLLQCIVAEDPDYAEASFLLAGAFEREAHWDLAAQKLQQHIGTYRHGTAPADKYARLATLLEQAGSFERALEVLEDLRQREPTYPNIASRIELLHKQRSVADRTTRSGNSGATSAAETAFISQYRYEILEEIGRGGMGVVFRARDRRLDRVVALKRLLEDLTHHQPRSVQLFLREAQAAARLNHPNIVTVFDTDQEDGAFFITMELLEGEPFNRILKKRGQLPVGKVVRVGMEVAAGLDYAHEQGVIHRDVKTANLFLTTDRVVKIMDFGLAKMFQEVRGGTTVITGTPFYMSPEQIVGGPVGREADLYSLGITLYELVTGRVPFSKGDVAYHHCHTAPPDPRSFVPDLPDEFCEILLSLIDKDPARRGASAHELGERLSEFGRDIMRDDLGDSLSG